MASARLLDMATSTTLSPTRQPRRPNDAKPWRAEGTARPPQAVPVDRPGDVSAPTEPTESPPLRPPSGYVPPHQSADTPGPLAAWNLEHDNIGPILDPFEHELTTVLGDVEIMNVEIRRQAGQLTLRARLQIDTPQILVGDAAPCDD